MNKKKFFAGVFALVLAVAAGYGVKNSMNNDAQLSDRAIANIEALANNESDGGGITGECWQGISLTNCSVTCPKCNTRWEPNPKVPRANAVNIKGKCRCGFSFD
jgi:hypothetical protein